MTRSEHLAWAKARARAYLARGDVQNAVASMVSDLTKHPETAESVRVAQMLGMRVLLEGDAAEAERYIDGFG